MDEQTFDPGIFGSARTRRDLLRTAGAVALGAMVAGPLAACASEEDAGPGGPAAPATGAPTETFTEPTRRLSGELKILLWSHFVPSHDTWFDRFVSRLGPEGRRQRHGRPHRPGPDHHPHRGRDLGRAGARPDPVHRAAVAVRAERARPEGRHRRGRSSAVGTPARAVPQVQLQPEHRQVLRVLARLGARPGQLPQVAVGAGRLPQRADHLGRAAHRAAPRSRSRRACRWAWACPRRSTPTWSCAALMWSYGASIQDANAKVVLNSPQTVAAVEFMARLFKETMTNEVFSWNAASNNQGLVAGKLSYIVNSISAWRTAQGTNPDVADDMYFVPAAARARRQRSPRSTCCTTGSSRAMPRNADAAKEFLLHYTENYAAATYASASSTTSARATSCTPNLNAWLANDPFGSKPANKLDVPHRRHQVEHEHRLPRPGQHGRGRGLQHVHHPQHVRPGRPAASRPPQAVGHRGRAPRSRPIFAKWRAQGLVGGWMAVVEVTNLVKEYDSGVGFGRRRGQARARHRRRRPGQRGGRVPRPARPVRLRQDHAAAHDRRSGAARPPATCSSTATS